MDTARMTHLTRRQHAYILLLINTISFGSALPIVKWGIGQTHPFSYLFYRLVLVFILTLPVWCIVWKDIKRWPKHTLIAIGLELLGSTCALGLLYIALNIGTAVEISVLMTAGPVFLVFFGLVFLHEKVTRKEWTGLGIAVIGVLLLAALPLFRDGWQGTVSNGLIVGLLMLIYHLINSTYFTLVKPIYKKIPKIFAPLASSLLGSVSFGLLSFLTVGQHDLSTWSTVITTDLRSVQLWIVLVFAATIVSIVGWTAYIKAQDLIEISEAGLFSYLQPLIYIPLSFFLLGEQVTLLHVVGLVLVAVGVLVAERRTRRR